MAPGSGSLAATAGSLQDGAAVGVRVGVVVGVVVGGVVGVGVGPTNKLLPPQALSAAAATNARMHSGERQVREGREAMGAVVEGVHCVGCMNQFTSLDLYRSGVKVDVGSHAPSARECVSWAS